MSKKVLSICLSFVIVVGVAALFFHFHNSKSDSSSPSQASMTIDQSSSPRRLASIKKRSKNQKVENLGPGLGIRLDWNQWSYLSKNPFFDMIQLQHIRSYKDPNFKVTISYEKGQFKTKSAKKVSQDVCVQWRHYNRKVNKFKQRKAKGSVARALAKRKYRIGKILPYCLVEAPNNRTKWRHYLVPINTAGTSEWTVYSFIVSRGKRSPASVENLLKEFMKGLVVK